MKIDTQLATRLAALDQLTEPPLASILFDGLTQYGTVTFPADLTLVSGLSFAIQVKHTSGASSLAKVRKASGEPFLDAATTATGVCTAAWSDSVGGSVTTVATTDPGADTAGFELVTVSVLDVGGGDLTSRVVVRGPSGYVEEENTGVGALSALLAQFLMFNDGGVAYCAGSVVRVAMWLDGELSVANSSSLYGDGTLAGDWQIAIYNRAPAYEWRMWRGVEAGSTLIVPEVKGGPIMTLVGTGLAALDYVTLPTGSV